VGLTGNVLASDKDYFMKVRPQPRPTSSHYLARAHHHLHFLCVVV
jgi:hypothetical protein